MAESNLTSTERLRVYDALFRLNRSFTNAVNTLHRPSNINVLDRRRLWELRGLIKELQSEANFHLLETLQGIEENDRFRWGRVRIARDHRLNPERPPFNPHQ